MTYETPLTTTELRRLVVETVIPGNYKWVARDQNGSVHVYEYDPPYAVPPAVVILIIPVDAPLQPTLVELVADVLSAAGSVIVVETV